MIIYYSIYQKFL